MEREIEVRILCVAKRVEIQNTSYSFNDRILKMGKGSVNTVSGM